MTNNPPQMRAILSSSVLIAFILFSCQKEISYENDGNVVKIDSAVGNFVKAAGITNESLKASLNTLVVNAKNHGWWDLCLAIYPLAGGTSSSSSFNLKDTAAYRVTWSGSPIFTNPGTLFGDGVSFGNTGLNDSILTFNNAHISFYSNTNDTTIDQWVMGVDDATVPYNELTLTNAGFKQAVAYFFTNNGTFSTEQPSTIGWYLVSSGNTDVRIYKDGADVTSTTESPIDSHAKNTFLIGTSRNLGGTNTQCAFSTIGVNIDGTMAALMYSDIRDFVNKK
jgi:hypothetical protein